MFKKYGVTDSVAPRRWDVDLVTSVVFVRVADVIAACCVWSPRLTGSGIKVSFDLDLAPKRREWMSVVVVGAPKVSVCGNGGADPGWTEEIECVLGLW